jgi:hypothetical protein
MKAYGMHSGWPGLLAVLLLSGCTTSPAPPQEALPTAAVAQTEEAEAAILPLLGYLPLLQRMSPPQLLRERATLTVTPPTPITQLRLALLLGQPRAVQDLVRALSLLEAVLKSSDPAATSLHPLARVLASQYQERLKLATQNEKLLQQLKESQHRNGELQEKLDALTAIERSLSVRPAAGSSPPGAPR